MKLAAHLKLPSSSRRRLQLAVLVASVSLCGMSRAPVSRSPASSAAIFDPDPNHLWNRVNAALFLRTDRSGTEYGAGAIDLLLWNGTTYMLTGPSHQRALSLLDEFLRTHAENQVTDPVKRAWFQRNLWAVFDWSAQIGSDDYRMARQELQVRLADILPRVAMTPSQIKSLPDNYAQAVASGELAKEYDPAHPDRPFLPPDLLQSRGSWVCIQGDGVPVAEGHVSFASGRSRFLVFLHLPQGREATLKYIQTLWNVDNLWTPNEMEGQAGKLNPQLPQFPVGSEVAMVRQMMLFDRTGELVPTPITESIQIRVYKTIPVRGSQMNGPGEWDAARKEQDFYEIRLHPEKLFARQAGGLQAVGPDNKEFPIFQTQGKDAFDPPTPLMKEEPILQRCAVCHAPPGINSVWSRRELIKPNPPQRDPDPPYDARWWETQNTLEWKTDHYDWGLFNGYWHANTVSGPR